MSKSTNAKLDDKLLEMYYEFIKGFEFSLDIHEGFECDSSLEGWALSGFAATVRSAAVTLQLYPSFTLTLTVHPPPDNYDQHEEGRFLF